MRRKTATLKLTPTDPPKHPAAMRQSPAGQWLTACVFFVEAQKGKSESVNMVKEGWMPFVPTAGTMVATAPGDDYRKVEEVYYMPGEAISIYFEFEEGTSPAYLKKLGWKEEE